MKPESLTRFLYGSSLVYLILPYIVFMGGWIRQPFSTIFILVLLMATFLVARGFFLVERGNSEAPSLPWRSMMMVLLAVLPFALIAGAGGWGPQDSDWLKHNSILRDLITEPWPVIYDLNNKQVMLTYYIAYQLPAAFVGKILGWEAANHALFLYTLCGFFLAALWVWLLAGAKYWWTILIFIVFSGMDVVGFVMSALFLEPTFADAFKLLSVKFSTLYHIEWWSGWGFAQFSSMASLMVWVPNQSISGWLLMALVLSDARHQRVHVTGALFLGLSTLWAPFVTLGLLPFVVVIAIVHWRAQAFSAQYLRQCFSNVNVVGVLLAALVTFYLAGRFQTFEMPVDTGALYEEGITLTFLRLPDLFVLRYFLFIVLEFAVLHVLLYSYLWLFAGTKHKNLQGLLMIATPVLLALPILNWGWNNEPSMRSSIPAIFVTALITLIVITDKTKDLRAMWIRRMIASLLVVGSLTAVTEFGRHMKGVYEEGGVVRIPPQGEVRTLFELQEQRYNEYYSFIGQYVGSADSQFLRVLGKQ